MVTIRHLYRQRFRQAITRRCLPKSRVAVSALAVCSVNCCITNVLLSLDASHGVLQLECWQHGGHSAFVQATTAAGGRWLRAGPAAHGEAALEVVECICAGHVRPRRVWCAPVEKLLVLCCVLATSFVEATECSDGTAGGAGSVGVVSKSPRESIAGCRDGKNGAGSGHHKDGRLRGSRANINHGRHRERARARFSSRVQGLVQVITPGRLRTARGARTPSADERAANAGVAGLVGFWRWTRLRRGYVRVRAGRGICIGSGGPPGQLALDRVVVVCDALGDRHSDRQR